MNLSASLRLTFWIAVCEGVFVFLSRSTAFPELHWVPVAFLGLGIFIFMERPIARAGYAAAFETAVSALFAFVFFSHLAWTFLEPRLEAERVAGEACGPLSIERQCYTFSKENCSSLWSHFHKDCNETVQKELAAKPSTSLVGPRVRRCTYQKLDRSFRSNRRTPTNPICNTHFSSLEGIANQ